MTTYYPYQPSSQAPFQFQPTLDDEQYAAIVSFLAWGQRPYITIQDSSGNVVVYKAVVSSPDGLTVETLTWDSSTGTGQVSVVTTIPHGFKVGATVELTVAGAVPNAFNGEYSMLAIDEATLVYALPLYPGIATSPGALFNDVSLTDGYFDSTLVFRESSATFEVSP